MKRNLIIYRDDLLWPSEGFVLAQGESLQSFQPFYVGLRRNGPIPLPNERTLALAAGRVSGPLTRRWFSWVGPTQRAAKRIAALRPALIHAHFGPDGTHILPIAEALDVPLLVTFHGYDATLSDEALKAHSLSLRLYVRRRSRLCAKGSLFLCVSEFVREKLLAKGFPLGRTRVHYIGVDTDFFRPDPAVERAPLVLFVGRLVESKGCEYLLRAMSIVQQLQPEAQIAIIGDGPLRDALVRQAAELRIRNCRFLGVQPPAIVRQWMNRARVFCVPSVEVASGASEGFGLVLAEAQSMGVPVVSFRTGGIPEAVADGRTALLAPPRSWELLAKHIHVLLTSDGLWDRFGSEGRRRVIELFNLKTQSAFLEQIYAQVLGVEEPVTLSCAAQGCLT